MKSKSSSEFFSRIWALLLLDIALWFVTLIGSFTVRRLLVGLFPDHVPQISVALCAVYLVLYYAALTFVMVANPRSRAAWLNLTAGKDYSFKRDILDFLKYDFLDEVICYLVVCLPVHLMLAYMGDMGIVLSQFFIGQSAIFAIFECDVWLAYIINMVVYALFWLVTITVAHYIWNRSRLRR